MKLAPRLKTQIIDNFLGKISDEELIKYVQRNLSILPCTDDKYDTINLKRIENSTFDNFQDGKFVVDLLCSKFFELDELDEERISQIELYNEKIPTLKNITSAHKWLSGGITVNYSDENNSKHSIYLNYPIRPARIILSNIIGALYIDKRLVPVRSFLEAEIIQSLQKSDRRVDLDDAIETIISFVNSNEYIKIAKKIGRKA